MLIKEYSMKAATFVLTLLCLFPHPSLAGQVSGTLRESGKPVPANIKVEAMCGGSTYSAVTDNYGSYKLFAKETGKCRIRVYYQNQTPEADFDSYPNPARNDFNLIRQPDGRYELRRT
jgi:hypothetical protein